MPWEREVMQLDSATGRDGVHVRSATRKFRINSTTHCDLNLISHYSNYLWAGLYWAEKRSVSVRVY